MAIGKFSILGVVLGGFLLVIGLFAGYTWVTLHWSYSKGERAGYVQKISKKGWVFKTWEGELQLLPVPGVVPEKFLFTVRDDVIAQKINNSMGKKVTVNYEQHKGVPSAFFGETEYFVTEIKPIE